MNAYRCRLRSCSRRRSGFTLTEILIVMMIIGIITTMSITAASGFMRRAKVDATQSLISQLHVALQERLDAFYSGTRNNISATTEEKIFAGGNAATPDGTVIGRRAKVIALLDAMRGEFPQTFMEILRQGDNPNGFGDMQTRPVRTAIYMTYLQKGLRNGSPQVTSAAPFTPTNIYQFPTTHTSVTESSECLYLLLSIPVPGSVFDITQIPIRFVTDADGDGLKEFIDAWGNPLRFYRAPTDLLAYYIDGTDQLPKTLLKSANPLDYSVPVVSNNLDPDGMLTEANWFANMQRQNTFEKGGAVGGKNSGCFYRLHWPYATPTTLNSPIDPTTGPQPNVARAYPVIPMIISAGPDGKFGLNRETVNFEYGTLLPLGSANWTDFVCARVDPAMIPSVKDNIINLQLEKGRVR